jgi:hypothetical protein
MTTRIGGNMLRGSSSFPDPRHHASRFLSSFHLIIPVLILLLILSSCSYRQASGGRTPPSGGWWYTVPDSDEDGIPDSTDNCPQVANKDQEDLNGDGWGDVCADTDGDQIVDSEDRWPLDEENDIDEDGFGADSFGNCDFICAGCEKLAEICRQVDNCPYKENNDQADADKDGRGDVCDFGIGAEKPDCHPRDPCPPPIDDSPAETDTDGDNIPDSEDLCVDLHISNDPNPPVTDPVTGSINHLNTDGDGYGDACDPDDDNDSICDGAAASTDPGTPSGGCSSGPDNCVLIANNSQDDLDCDGQGDVCDTDRDGDGYSDADEISTHGTSPTKADTDDDGITDGDEAPECPPNLTAGPDPTPLGAPKTIIAFEVKDVSGTVITDKWIPAHYPGGDQTTQSWEQRSQVTIIARLQDPSDPSATFTNDVTFEIDYSSNHEGVAINDEEVFTTEPADDFSFNDTVSGHPTDTLQTVPGAGFTGREIDLYAFDFGGSVIVKVTTTYNGANVEGQIALPLDSDNDGLPDAWENAHAGFNPFNEHTFDPNTLDDLADIDTSLDNNYPTDGLTNFHEYRGIIFDPPNASAFHKRLNPWRKDLFVRGDNFQNSIDKPYLAQTNPPLNDPDVLPFSVDYATVYNKPGIPSAFGEAGIDVHDVTGMSSFSQTTEPPNIDILVVTNKTDKNSNGMIVTLLGQENGYINHNPAPLKPRDWRWDLKGASYIGDALDYAVLRISTPPLRATETYYLCLMHYFFNRPYLNEDISNTVFTTDPGWPASSCYSSVYLDRLEPLDRVEDYYIENGTNPPDSKGQKIDEDRCVDNNVLDGDRIIPDWKGRKWGNLEFEAGLHYSVFDAEGDGRVENPAVDDSASLDPNQLDAGEYTLEQVQLHTVLHEMGHAVGMSDQHTADPSCLMYNGFYDWDRAGHFSPAARSQILIHNQ